MNTLDDKFEKCIRLYGLSQPTRHNYRNAISKQIEYDALYIAKDWFDMGKYLADNLTQAYVPKPKSKLYFYKGCQMPRYKVRNWGKADKISITTKVELADASFINANHYRNLLKRAYGHAASRVDLIAYLKSIKDSADTNRQEIIDILEKNTCDFTVVPYNFANVHAGYKSSYIHNSNANSNYRAFNCITDDVYTDLTQLFATQNIYFDTDIAGFVNENCTTIDSVMHKQLQNMFSSTDSKDHKIALEVLTNCNTNESLFYILLLLQEFGPDVIWNLKERTHVGFKSLIEYIGEKNWEWLSYDSIAEILMEKDVLTFEMVKHFAQHVKEDMVKQNKHSHFHISTITVSDKIKEYLKQSIQKSPQPQEDNVELIASKE